MIRFQNVTLGYGKRVILKDINEQIVRGGYLGIVGPNGSGKTTMLKSILGWVKPQAGQIQFSQKIHFGYVPQRNTIDALYPLTALDIVLMGLYSGRHSWQRLSAEDRQTAHEALAHVRLSEKAGDLFGELSGGQQQRVLLARALAGKPDVLILDEPTNGMDIVSESSVMEIVREIHERQKMTTILVTHLLHVVAHYADTIGLIKNETYTSGKTSDLLTSKHLSEIYGTHVVVSKVEGKTVVMIP